MALVNKPDESIFASSAKQGEVDNFPDLLRGWGITFDQTQGIPPMEWFNFLFKRLDEKHTYLMQRGLPEWSATQDYTKGSCVQFDGVSYRALKNSKNNHPNESNSQYWVRWGFTLAEIARATLTQYGVTQLYTGYDSQREDLALTPKTAHLLKQFIDSNTRALGNYIPNSKKSSRVDSDSADDVATPKAVKTAYEKAVAAENLAKTKWTAKAATETTAGILPISHKTDGTAKDKFASEFAVGEKADRNHKHEVSDIVDFNNSVTGLIKNVVRKTYQQTKQHKKKIKIRVRKGHGYVYEDGEETINIQTEGTMTVYPNGKIEQIIAFRNFSPTWFGAETNDNALHIPVQLWSSMPNKVDYVTVFLNKTKSGAQYASEATEWILGWAEDIQEQIKDKVTIRAVRWTGGQDEPVDLIIKVEGY